MADLEKSERKLGYPKAVIFISSSEICERFSYFGLTAVLALYLRDVLKYSQETAILIMHVVILLSYAFSIFGAVISDSYIGKYRTIFWFSIFHAVGNLIVAFGSTLAQNARPFCLVGLFLTTLGVGGIKPCVSAFGGEQFVLPQQEKWLKQFFSIFYCFVNVGALAAVIFMPLLRENVSCLGRTNCYPLAFSIPAALMLIALVAFVCGKPWYKHRNPEGNVLADALKCIFHALRRKFFGSGERNIKPRHWLDHAADKFDMQLIKDVRETLRVLVIFLAAPVFWALMHQLGSSWTFQASMMDGGVYNWFVIQPEQTHILNPLSILIFVPTFEVFLYPLLAKIRIGRPLQLMTIGAILCCVSFLMASYLEYLLQPSYAVMPQPESGQLRIFNGFPCELRVDPPIGGVSEIPPRGALQSTQSKIYKSLSLNENVLLQQNSNCSHTKISSWTGSVTVYEEKSTSFFVMESENGSLKVKSIPYFDDVTKAHRSRAKIRLIHNLDGEVIFMNHYGEQTNVQVSKEINVSPYIEPYPGRYNIFFRNTTVLSNLELSSRGVYTIVLHQYGNEIVGSLHVITPPAPLHIIWIMPQILVQAIAEIFFAVTATAFSYTEAPESMKSFVSAMYSLTAAAGNFLVVLIEAASLFQNMVYHFLFFAGLMALDVLFMIALAIPYKYKKYGEKIENHDSKDNLSCHAKTVKNDKLST